MPFIDFQELKERVSFADAIQLLDLDLKRHGHQWRGPCPTCQTGGDRALVITDAKGFFCFASKVGGDQISLAAHVLDLSVKDAALELARRGTVPVTSTCTRDTGTVPKKSTVPESEARRQEKLQPLAYLKADHPAVEAIGFSVVVAEKLGVGYAGKGLMRGTVAVPIRDEDGTLLGYIGITEAKLPSDFTGNVVKLVPKSA